MKKYLLLILLFIGSVEAYSQIEKGTYLLGGSGSLSYHSSYTDVNLFLAPSFHYFITDHISIGAFTPVYTNFSSIHWGIGTSARYYFDSKSDKSLYTSLAISLTDIIYIENTLDNNPVTIGLGHVWFLNKSVGIEAQLNCGTDFDDFDVNLSVGFQIYLNNK